jgi:hypothetical protein
MFPIDQTTLDYDHKLLAEYDRLVAAQPSGPFPKLAALLPKVAKAGEDGGSLDAHGADLLGLPVGTPLAPAEGDQPAALAGSLIGAAGQVSMSFGTSVVANSVGDRAFQGISRAVDHFCAPDGKPINMVWIRNGTTPMNTVVGMFGLAGAGSGGKAFETLMPLLLAAPDDCGGLLALPFMDDEPGVGVQRGGTALVMGLNERSATPGNVARAMLLATIFNLRHGSDSEGMQWIQTKYEEPEEEEKPWKGRSKATKAEEEPIDAGIYIPLLKPVATYQEIFDMLGRQGVKGYKAKKVIADLLLRNAIVKELDGTYSRTVMKK